MSRRPAKAVSDDSVASLQEQVRLLSLENEKLRNIISDKGLDDVLQARTENDNQTVENKHISIKGENRLAPNRPRQRSTSAVKRKSPNMPGTPSGSKGCSCKGNCSNRVCGCVKKSSMCTALCRCSNTCQNMDADKENNEAPNDHASESVSQAQNKASKKNTTSRGGRKLNRVDFDEMDVDDNVFADSKPPNKAKTKGQTNKKTATKKVTKNKNEVADHSDDNSESEPELPNAKNKKKVEPKKEALAGRRNRNNRINSEDSDEDAAKTSQESDDSEFEPEIDVNKKKAIDKKKKPVAASKGRKNRKDSEESDEYKFKQSRDSDESESEHKMDKNRKKNVINKQKPVAASKNRKNRIDSNDSDENEAEEPQDSRSESDGDDKTKTLTVPNNEATAMYKKKKRLFSEDEEDSESMDQTESMPEPETSNNKKKPGKHVAAASNAADEESNDDDLPSENDRSRGIDRKGKAQLQASAPLNNSSDMDNTFSPEKLEVAEDFNPMKPRRQLSRSPIPSHPDLSIRQRILDRSEILLPIPQQEKQEEDIPPPEELEQDVVDWNKHQSELLECKNCKRKFYPYRLKKHEAFCHNI